VRPASAPAGRQQALYCSCGPARPAPAPAAVPLTPTRRGPRRGAATPRLTLPPPTPSQPPKGAIKTARPRAVCASAARSSCPSCRQRCAPVCMPSGPACLHARAGRAVQWGGQGAVPHCPRGPHRAGWAGGSRLPFAAASPGPRLGERPPSPPLPCPAAPALEARRLARSRPTTPPAPCRPAARAPPPARPAAAGEPAADAAAQGPVGRALPAARQRWRQRRRR
jgi:hypothetical protein